MKKSEIMSESQRTKIGFKKRYVPWNKGLTKETDERVRLNSGAFKKEQTLWNKGTHNSSNGMLGKHHSEATKEKIRLKRKLQTITDETKKKISKGNTGKVIPIEQRIRMSISRKKFFETPAGDAEKKRSSKYNKEHYLEHLGKISYERRLEIVSKVRKELANDNKTQIEFLMEKELTKRNIRYIPEHRILNYIVDFFLPDFYLVIECDGTYWHNYPNGLEKDRIRDQTLLDNGYKVYRFWEHEIKESSKVCIEKIKELRGY